MIPELRFTCQPGCTNCCEQKGYVYLNEEDLVRAARHAGMTPAAFEKQYVYRTARKMRFRKPPGKQCPFLETGKGCTIHPGKPAQCRLFPFWPELVENRAGWYFASRYCPGIGKGELIQIGDALETAEEMKRAYPENYR
jgi:hypothetical protein